MAEDEDHEIGKARWMAVEDAAELINEERYLEALAALRDALRADPANGYAYFFIGVALFECGQLEGARDAYRACLRVSPRHLGARVALSHVLRKLGAYREAIAAGVAALDQAPADGDALYAVGMAHWARGDLPAAERYLAAFLRAGPELEIKAEVEAILARIAAQTPGRN
jgi:tetratricopeptide (TPR) repeat protein